MGGGCRLRKAGRKMSMTFSELGRTIAGKREALGISREELAGRLGIKPKTVEKWEAGKKAPRFRQLAPLGEALGVPAEELLPGGDGDGADRLKGYSAAEKRARLLQITGGLLLATGLITGVLAVPGVAAAILLRTWALPGPSDTIGIIGGADGPTAILVTGAAVGNLFWYLIPVVLLLLGVLLLALGCRRKR